MIWHSVDGGFGMQTKHVVPGTLISIEERKGKQNPLSLDPTREMLFQFADDTKCILGEYVRNMLIKAIVIARLKEAEIEETLEVHMPDRMKLAKEWLFCNVISRSIRSSTMNPLFYTAFKPGTYIFVPMRKGQKRRLDITVL